MDEAAERNGVGGSDNKGGEKKLVGPLYVPPAFVPGVSESLNDLFLTPSGYSDEVTLGKWYDEKASAREFDRRVNNAGCFKVYREVEGEYIQPRLMGFGYKQVKDDDDESNAEAKVKTPRIDRLLIPKKELVEAGWPHGPIGVEIKASGIKIGGPILQAIDYSRAVFTPHQGYHYLLEWIAIWPWRGSAGNIASIADQNRICGVYFGHDCILDFQTDIEHGIRIGNDRSIRANRFRSGYRTGSRNGKKRGGVNYE